MARMAPIAAAFAVCSLALAPAALAQSDLYDDFQGDGQINPCDYSPGQLQSGLENLPQDLQQYAPGFGDQLRAGLEAQCGGGAVPTQTETTDAGAPAGAAGPPTKTRFPRPPSPRPLGIESLGEGPAPLVGAAPAGSDSPDGLALMLVAAGLLALGLGAAVRLGPNVGGGRLFGPLRASFGDLGGRTADALAYARDVVRFGR